MCSCTPSLAEGVLFMAIKDPKSKSPGRQPWAFIFVNGQIPNLQRARQLLAAGDWLVAADGGARHVMKMGLIPHRVVGDLDSLSDEDVTYLEQAGAQIERYPVEKDETDLELALRAALAGGWKNIRIVGALGGRFDQSLGNLFLLTQPGLENYDIRLDDGMEEVFLIRQKGWIDGEIGDTVSLIPLGTPVKNVVTSGLHYPLNGETLLPDRTRGISNVLTAPQADVSHDGGVLVCIHTRASGDPFNP